MKILIAEDDRVSSILLEKTLETLGHEAVCVGDGNEALAALLDPLGPRLAILDWMMPGMDGPEICETVRRCSSKYVYILLLTARKEAHDVVRALNSGADDFLTKPFDPSELQARMRAGLRILRLEQKLLETQAVLHEQATRDHLTGLWNRRKILERLEKELEGSADGKVAVILADVDRFKRINDTLGHAVGDTVLRQIARRIGSQLRDVDAVGRYGGEEFLVVVPGAGNRIARRVAERIRGAVSSAPVRVEDDGGLEVTLSLGVACSTEGVDLDLLVSAADDALYRAKENGRDRVEVSRRFPERSGWTPTAPEPEIEIVLAS